MKTILMIFIMVLLNLGLFILADSVIRMTNGESISFEVWAVGSTLFSLSIALLIGFRKYLKVKKS